MKCLSVEAPAGTSDFLHDYTAGCRRSARRAYLNGGSRHLSGMHGKIDWPCAFDHVLGSLDLCRASACRLPPVVTP
jgi:hypothetical protein